MPQQLTAGLPQDVVLEDTYTIRWAAVDPTTGDDVAGVVVSDATLLAEPLSDAPLEQLQVGPFMLVPGPES